ncbi:MAG: FAD-dependent oxidoreductase [Pedobacter sp.]|nr:MAG: FAD-dependent oxidoreductase [Pedobacter sp.]
MQPKVAVIGSGFAGLSTAAHLAKDGYLVDVYEKNETIGGRARQLRTDNGYVFDMGPSWYWMPDVFEKFFEDFGYKPSDFYHLIKLDPGFSIVFGEDDVVNIPNDPIALDELFESIEKGSAKQLAIFMKEAEYKYNVGMKKLVYKPGLSFTEFIDLDIEYWDKRLLAPSSLIFYLGVTKKINKLQHHNLFFDEDLKIHADEIYRNPQWPSKPLFYVCCTSKTDEDVAPEGHENIFILMPLATGLTDTEDLREQYFEMIMNRLEKHTSESIRPYIDYKKSYCINDFVSDYNSYKGNAYGLANTLMQTANLKPSIKNRKLNNLFYAGQLTVPGPGVPPSIISGKVAAVQLRNYINNL